MGEAEASTAGLRTVRARATATGAPLPTPVVRAAMVARLASFARGGSGIAPDVAALLRDMLNRQVHPTVPRVGSIGSSDLVQMAHVGLVLLGEGEAEVLGARVDGGTALRRAGLLPVQLDGRDGLALCSASPLAAGTTALSLTQLEGCPRVDRSCRGPELRGLARRYRCPRRCRAEVATAARTAPCGRPGPEPPRRWRAARHRTWTAAAGPDLVPLRRRDTWRSGTCRRVAGGRAGRRAERQRRQPGGAGRTRRADRQLPHSAARPRLRPGGVGGGADRFRVGGTSPAVPGARPQRHCRRTSLDTAPVAPVSPPPSRPRKPYWPTSTTPLRQ